MINKTFWLTLAILLTLTACDTLGLYSGRARGQLQTVGAQFDVTVSDGYVKFEVPLKYTNDTEREAQFTGCFPPMSPDVDKLVGGEWIEAYQAVHLRCLSAPYTVEPGATLNYVFQANAAMPGDNAFPVWQGGEVAGTYRVRWQVEIGGQTRILLSNRFELRETQE